jgi:hypothetical protein
MFFRKHDKPMNDDEFADVIGRLRAERPEPTPLELDEIKMRAIRQATRRRGPATTGASMRRTLVVALATFSLMLTGTGAVIADKKDDKSNGKGNGKGKQKSHGSNAGKKQYSHCKKSGKSAKSNKSQQNCPTPPPSNGSGGSNGSGKSHGSN